MQIHNVRKGNKTSHRIHLNTKEYNLDDEVIVLKESDLNLLRKEIRQDIIQELQKANNEV